MATFDCSIFLALKRVKTHSLKFSLETILSIRIALEVSICENYSPKFKRKVTLSPYNVMKVLFSSDQVIVVGETSRIFLLREVQKIEKNMF